MDIVTRAEVRNDNAFILEKVTPFHVILQVHMSVFVDLFLNVARSHKCHFGNQNLSSLHIGIHVESLRSTIAKISQPGNATLF